MKWHVASIWETISDVVPDAIAVINADVRRTWRDYEGRAAALAGALHAAGLGFDSKVGIYAYNSNEYLEAQFAALKLRGAPVNVNYRYTEDELIYLLADSEAEALFFDAQFAQRVAAVRPHLPRIKCFIEIDDGSGLHLDGASAYEDLIAEHDPLPRGDYAEDDLYLFYTGGTTGMPKGVLYHHGASAQALMLGYDLNGLPRPTTADALVSAVKALHGSGRAPVNLAACPLMHGTGVWGAAFLAHNMGGAAVTIRNERFDADLLWRTVERERVTHIAIVGDVFANPMIAALNNAAAAGQPYDISSLRSLLSSGVMFSVEAKEALLKHADILIVDSMGATEGTMAASMASRANPPGTTAVFKANASTRVINPDGQDVRPGSDEVGMIATAEGGAVGYFKDPVKTAATFREIDGRRYIVPGDYAKVAADGSLILLGRGSSCINTGGEKVFPEEVEEALKRHPDIADCLVVGVPDARFGQRVTAVVSRRKDADLHDREVLDFLRTRLAGFKIPKQIIVVERVERAPNGKADYRWAKALAGA